MSGPGSGQLKLTEELDSLDKLVILRQIDQDDRLDITSIGHVPHCSRSTEKDGNDEHDGRENTRELFGLLHRLRDGNHTAFQLLSTDRGARESLQPNTLKGEYGGTDQQGERVAVEHDDIGHSVLCNGGKLVGRDVDNWDTLVSLM